MQGSIESGGTGYREIAEELRQNIGSGRIEVGSLLPTERELYSQFGVSRTTIRRALQDLVRSGWAVSQPNRGHIASQPSPARESRLVAFVDHANSIHQSLFFKLSQLIVGHVLKVRILNGLQRIVDKIDPTKNENLTEWLRHHTVMVCHQPEFTSPKFRKEAFQVSSI